MDRKGNQTVPEESVVRDDGCICPLPAPVKECKIHSTKLETCPYDPRFPNTNQTKHCYFSFIDYQRCSRLLGDYPGCLIFLRCYKALCPNSWTERWFEQMEKGTFPRKIYPSKPIVYPNSDLLKSRCAEDIEEEEEEEPVC